MAFGAIVQGGRQEEDREEAEEEIIQRMLNPLGYYKRQQQALTPSYITSAYNRIRGMKED